MRNSSSRIAAVACLFALAFAAESQAQFFACVQKNNGQFRLVSSPNLCLPSEREVSLGNSPVTIEDRDGRYVGDLLVPSGATNTGATDSTIVRWENGNAVVFNLKPDGKLTAGERRDYVYPLYELPSCEGAPSSILVSRHQQFDTTPWAHVSPIAGSSRYRLVYPLGKPERLARELYAMLPGCYGCAVACYPVFPESWDPSWAAPAGVLELEKFNPPFSSRRQP